MKHSYVADEAGVPTLSSDRDVRPMTDQPKRTPVEDPDNVPEVFCDGQFNVAITGNSIATITFTQVRPEPGALFRDGSVVPKSVVRARIMTPFANLIALRDLLNRVIQEPNVPAPPAGGPTRH